MKVCERSIKLRASHNPCRSGASIDFGNYLFIVTGSPMYHIGWFDLIEEAVSAREVAKLVRNVYVRAMRLFSDTATASTELRAHHRASHYRPQR